MAEFSKFSKILFQLLKKPQRLDQDDRVSDVDSQPHNVCPKKQPSPIASKIRLYALSYFLTLNEKQNAILSQPTRILIERQVWPRWLQPLLLGHFSHPQ